LPFGRRTALAFDRAVRSAPVTLHDATVGASLGKLVGVDVEGTAGELDG
jgi:hypothetical protein